MRLRGVKNQAEKIRAHPLVIENPTAMKGQWQQFFDNNNPIWLEIGIGLGGFIAGMQQAYPHINFVGLEKYSSALVRTLRNFPVAVANVALCRDDAANLTEIFDTGEIDRLFLNFSDPWPKKRHAKRRLTHRSFLIMYANMLDPAGEIHFKTDNQGLFEFSLQELVENNWEILYKTYDLHNSSEVENNIMTEYEKKFSDQGVPICKLIARRIII